MRLFSLFSSVIFSIFFSLAGILASTASAFENNDDAKEGSLKMMFDDEAEEQVKKEFSPQKEEEQKDEPQPERVVAPQKLKKAPVKKLRKKVKKPTKKTRKEVVKIAKKLPQLSVDEMREVSQIIAKIPGKKSEKTLEQELVEPKLTEAAEETKAEPKIFQSSKDFVEKPLEITEEAVEQSKVKTEDKKDESSMRISHLLISSINLNNDYQSTDSINEYKSTSGNLKLLSEIELNKNFFVRSYFNMTESKKAPDVVMSGDRFFENMGVRLEELNVGYQSNKVTALAGKFLLNFGNAWRWNKSIWLTNVASNYREAEKLGATAFLKLGNSNKTGRYHFGFATFTNDRKNFDNAAFSSRYSATKSDAKAGDTRSLQSYVLSMDVRFDFSARENLTYHFAYSDMAVDSRASSVVPTKIDSQKSWVAGMEYQYPFNDDVTLNPLFEYAAKKNLNGDSDILENYLTAAISAKYRQNWYFTTGMAQRRNFNLSDYGFDQKIVELSVGYEFPKTKYFDKMVIQFGYENQRTNNYDSLKTDNALGGLVRMAKNF